MTYQYDINRDPRRRRSLGGRCNGYDHAAESDHRACKVRIAPGEWIWSDGDHGHNEYCSIECAPMDLVLGEPVDKSRARAR